MSLSRRNICTSFVSFAAIYPNFSNAFAFNKKTELGLGKIIYENKLESQKDIANFKLEGQAKISFINNRLRLENALSSELGQKSNFVFWCDKIFPDNIEISWDFYPIKEPGLCVAFFAANGIGQDLFSKNLKPRNGEYEQYVNSDISALQVSYFRRRWEDERAFHLVNLRSAPGFRLLSQGADPIPDVEDAKPPYKIKIRKFKNLTQFFINDLLILEHLEKNTKTPSSGYLGFRQMAPLIAEYSNLKVQELIKL